MGTRLARLFAAFAVSAGVLAPGLPAGAVHTYDDVSSSMWSAEAIDYVAENRDWMRFSGGLFRPRTLLSRRLLARAIVRAFASSEPLDNALTFVDVPSSDPWFKYANVAVKRGWMTVDAKGAFLPKGTVNKRTLDRALVRALGLLAEARALQALATEDGFVFAKPTYFPYLQLAEELNLNYNYPSAVESRDLYPWEPVTREFTAYALFKAATAVGTWRLSSLQRYRTIVLPEMDATRRKVVQFALAYTGYPYVYAGEWFRSTPNGYCCGAQVQGGFDCSGFQWWVMRKASSGFPVTDVRPYAGWTIVERRASLIAKEAPSSQRVTSVASLAPGDLVFFDADGHDANYLDIDHGGVALGNGWFIHSSGSRGGVVISWLGDGWWADAFAMGRRLFSWTPTPEPEPTPTPTPTPTPSPTPTS